MGDDLEILDRMISRHEAAIAALRAARDLITLDVEPKASVGKAIALLPGPYKGKGKRKRQARGDKGEAVLHEVDGLDVSVTPLQSKVLDQLNEAEGALHAAQMAQAIGGTTPLAVKYAIEDLRRRLAEAGSKAEINGYRGRGYILESEQGS